MTTNSPTHHRVVSRHKDLGCRGAGKELRGSLFPELVPCCCAKTKKLQGIKPGSDPVVLLDDLPLCPGHILNSPTSIRRSFHPIYIFTVVSPFLPWVQRFKAVMHYKFIAGAFLGLFLSAAAEDAGTNAPVVTDNQPVSFHYASLLEKDNTTVWGGIQIRSLEGPSALQVEVLIGGIPEGQFLNYHIHEFPVPEDGNCYLTGAHLDPYGRGQEPPCDITRPNTCEVGDLSGKHGPAWAPPGGDFRVAYSDFFLSNTPGEPAYFGDLSWVVHGPGGERLTCGNFEEYGKDWQEWRA
ncbi:putative cytosolic Cu/Zn superoxide dismutase [Aspergillus lucknowensis]|uniref:Superoxide dismutase n=1 Tax=Aspergillus lucknowensis TaxID=176173 RepID=A0ABR4LQ15_9EURO